MTELVNLILSAILAWFTGAVTMSVNDFLSALLGGAG